MQRLVLCALALALPSCTHKYEKLQLRNFPFEVAPLMMTRHGDDESAFMITKDIIKAINPHKPYRISLRGLEPSQKPIQKKLVVSSLLPPPHTCVTGAWMTASDDASNDANILGGFGTLQIDANEVVIARALASKEALSYYGAELYKVGEDIEFDADTPLPLTMVSIGANYASGYLMKGELGGGFYLEYHDRPHFHMPSDANARGYLILGKKVAPDQYHLSAFNIPFGYAIYTPGNVIHADSMLVGEYFVVFSVTKNFSTALLKNKNGALIKVSV